MMKRYLEFHDDKSHKFWAIEVQGTSHTVRFGKVGAKGTEKRTDFDSPEEGQASAEKLLRQKLNKGYVEVAAPAAAAGADAHEPQRAKPRKPKKSSTGGDGQPLGFEPLSAAQAESFLENAAGKIHIDLDEAQTRELTFQLHRGDLAVESLSVQGAMIIDGDLTVAGGLEDAQQEDFTLLVVLGKLTAGHLTTFASISVVGDVAVSQVIYGNSNNDFGLYCGGSMKAPVLVDGGHFYSAKQALEVDLLVGQQVARRWEDSSQGVRRLPTAGLEVLPKGVLGKDGALDEKKLLSRIRSGKELWPIKTFVQIIDAAKQSADVPPTLYEELLRFQSNMYRMTLDELAAPVADLFEQFAEDEPVFQRDFWDVFNIMAPLTDALAHSLEEENEHRPAELEQLLSVAGPFFAAFPSCPEARLPKLRDMFVWTGWAQLMLDKPTDAVASLQRGLEIDAASPQAYFLLGLAQARLGKVNEAKASMAEAIGQITVANSFQSDPCWLSGLSQLTRQYRYQDRTLSAPDGLCRFAEEHDLKARLKPEAVKEIEAYVAKRKDRAAIAEMLLERFG